MIPKRRHNSVGKLIRSRGFALVSVAALILSRYVLDVGVARSAGPKEYGVFAILLAYSTTAAIIAGFGFPELANRAIPSLTNTGERTAFLTAGAIVALVLGLSIGFALYPILNWAVDPSASSVLFLVPLLIVSIAMFNLQRQVALVSEDLPLGLLSPSIVFLGAATAMGIVAEFGRGTVTSEQVVTILIVAYVCLSLIHWFREGASLHHPRLPELQVWMARSKTILIGNLATVFTAQIDLLLIALFTTKEGAGTYAAASRLSLTVTLALAGINLRDGPRFGRLLARGDSERAWLEYQRSRRLSSTLGLLALVIFLIGGRRILGIYGDEFADSLHILIILAVGRLASSMTGPVALLLIAAGKEKEAARAAWAGLLLAILLIIGLGNPLGPVGVALGVGAGITLQNAWQSVVARQTVREA